VATFPVVDLKPDKTTAKISMYGDEADISYISRHMKIEAVFNRGLTLKKLDSTPTQLNIMSSGKSGRLKSFVRWCYVGPALARPDKVTVDWGQG